MTHFRTWFVNFGAESFVFLGYVLSENDSSFERNNDFIYSQMFRRAVKFLKNILFRNSDGFHIFLSEFSSVMSGSVWKAKDFKVSVPFGNVAVETCVWKWLVVHHSLPVCPVCGAPLLLLSQETSALQPHSRQRGAKVLRQFRQGVRRTVSKSPSPAV